MGWQTLGAYGTCPCAETSHYENRTVEVRMTVDDGQLLLESVPQGACPICGSRVYKRAHLELIEDLMHNRPSKRTA